VPALAGAIFNGVRNMERMCLMKRALQIIGGVIGVIVMILVLAELWAQTESVIYLISLTCVFPFAIIFIVSGRFIRRKRPLLGVLLLLPLGALAVTLAWGNQFSVSGEGFSEVENAFLMNLGTEILGAALILLLLSVNRTLSNVILLGLAFWFMILIERSTGSIQDVYLNLSTELLGSLLAALVIYRFLERFDEKHKNPEP